jgi:hypothetical protein
LNQFLAIFSNRVGQAIGPEEPPFDPKSLTGIALGRNSIVGHAIWHANCIYGKQ